MLGFPHLFAEAELFQTILFHTTVSKKEKIKLKVNSLFEAAEMNFYLTNVMRADEIFEGHLPGDVGELPFVLQLNINDESNFQKKEGERQSTILSGRVLNTKELNQVVNVINRNTLQFYCPDEWLTFIPVLGQK